MVIILIHTMMMNILKKELAAWVISFTDSRCHFADYIQFMVF